MGVEVPDGWSLRQLQEVAVVLLSSVNKKATEGEPSVRLCNYMDVYTHPTISNEIDFMWATASPAHIEKLGLRPGDVMITKDSEDPSDIGVPSVVVTEFDEPVVCGYHLALLRPGEAVLGEFLAWAFRGRQLRNQFERRAHGTTRFGLTSSVIKRAEALLPPLPEQRKIAAILSSINDAIAVTRKVIEQTRRVKKGLLQTLMTRGIGHTRFKKTEIGEIPEAWKLVALEDLGRAGVPAVRSGPFGSSLKSEHFTDSGRPVITIQSLGEGRIEDEGLFFVSDEKALELQEYEVEPGDLVFSRVADIGRSVVIEENGDGWIISSNLIRISPDQAAVNSRYLMYCITGGGPVTRQIYRLAGEEGRPVVTSTMLKELWFPVPPKDEQDQLASRIRAVEDVLSENERMVVRLQVLKRGLMQDLLTGRVRVQSD